MLTRVEVSTDRGDLLKLPLDDDSSGYIVADIDGMGPVKATLVSSSFAGIAGEQYQSSRREPRNVKIKLKLSPDPATDTVEDLRTALYDYFMTETQVVMRFFKESGFVVEIKGVVETCEPVIFAKEPTMDISIMCFRPDFYELENVRLSGLWTANEEFLDFDYKGTVETGVLITIAPDRDVDELSVYHRLPNGDVQTLNFTNAPLLTGDVLTISTVDGEKGATLLRSGVISSVLYGVSPQSKWIELKRGTNGLRVYATGDAIPVTVDYVTKHGGL